MHILRKNIANALQILIHKSIHFQYKNQITKGSIWSYYHYLQKKVATILQYNKLTLYIGESIIHYFDLFVTEVT